MPTRHRVALVGILALVAGGAPARAFTLFGDPPSFVGVPQALEEAARWPAPPWQRVVLNVASMPGFGAVLGATQEEIDAANQVVADAFAAWSTPALGFVVNLEHPATTGETSPDPATGFDIDVFAVPGTHPAFLGTTFFGRAFVNTSTEPTRLLTNGQSFPGDVITGADVYLNIDAILPLKTGVVAIDALALQRLLMHEIGHALGFGHPNANNPFGAAANLDTDADPLNAIPIDPADPFAALAVSGFTDDEAVMSNRPCGEPPVLPCLALVNALQPDDLGARDALYPDLPPATGCPATPATGCSEDALNVTLLKDVEQPQSTDAGAKAKIVFRWVKGTRSDGQPLTQADFGDPTANDTQLCFYQDGLLRSRLRVPGGDDDWDTVSTKGFKYVDKTLTHDGILKIVLLGGDVAKGKAIVIAKGAGVHVPTFPMADLAGASYDVQLHIDGAPQCLGMSYGAGSSPNVFLNKDKGILKLKRVGP